MEVIIPPEEKVQHPKHYNQSMYEVIDVIADYPELVEGFCLGNVIKYTLRCNSKNNKVEDLKKADFYLRYYINKLQGEHSPTHFIEKLKERIDG
jgi:hypothetical protein